MTNRHYTLAVLGGMCFGIVLVLAALYTSNVTSTNESCAACHVHPDAETSWKQSPHFAGESGVQTDCAACHLPPEGTAHYYWAKATTGLRDVWMYLTHDKEDFDWESKRTVEYAPRIVYNESCKKCHTNIFPQGLSDDGVAAHLYYEENEEKLGLQCVSCHQHDSCAGRQVHDGQPEGRQVQPSGRISCPRGHRLAFLHGRNGGNLGPVLGVLRRDNVGRSHAAREDICQQQQARRRCRLRSYTALRHARPGMGHG